jgi:hypothetical protein
MQLAFKICLNDTEYQCTIQFAFSFVFCIFCVLDGDWTHGFTHARQMLSY